jgi:hypothetical protein
MRSTKNNKFFLDKLSSSGIFLVRKFPAKEPKSSIHCKEILKVGGL